MALVYLRILSATNGIGIHANRFIGIQATNADTFESICVHRNLVFRNCPDEHGVNSEFCIKKTTILTSIHSSDRIRTSVQFSSVHRIRYIGSNAFSDLEPCSIMRRYSYSVNYGKDMKRRDSDDECALIRIDLTI